MASREVTKWTCDVCKVACFDRYQDAVIHEAQCRAKNASNGSNSTKVSNTPQATPMHPGNRPAVQARSQQVLPNADAINTAFNAHYNAYPPLQQQQQQQQQQQLQQQQQQQQQQHHRMNPQYTMIPGHMRNQVPNQLQFQYGQQQVQQHQNPQQVQGRPSASAYNILPSIPAPTGQNQNPQQEQHKHNHTVVKQLPVPNLVSVSKQKISPSQRNFMTKKSNKNPTKVRRQTKHPPPQAANSAPGTKPRNQMQASEKKLQKSPSKERRSKKSSPACLAVDQNGKPMQTVWTCDICLVKEFQSYEDAVEHERLCKMERASRAGKKSGSGKSPSRPNSKGGSKSAVPEVTRTVAKATSPNKNSEDPQPHNPALDIYIPPQVLNIPKGSSKPLIGNCYACDVCKKAFFREYEEAVEHEELCQQLQDRNAALAAFQVANLKFIESQAVRKLQKEKDERMKKKNRDDNAAWNVERTNSAKGEEEVVIVLDDDPVGVQEPPTKLQTESKSKTDQLKNADAKSAEENVIHLDSDASDGHELPAKRQSSKSKNLPVPSPLSPQKSSSETNTSPDGNDTAPSKFPLETNKPQPLIASKDDPYFAKLSPINKLFVSYMDLTTEQKKIGFSCHFCSQRLSTMTPTGNANAEYLGKGLPQTAYEHFKKCTKIDVRISWRMNLIQRLPDKESGYMPFHRFFDQFCKKHKIVNSENGGIEFENKTKQLNGTKTDKVATKLDAAKSRSVYSATVDSLSARTSDNRISIKKDVTVPMLVPPLLPLFDYMTPYHKSQLDQLHLTLSEQEGDSSVPPTICIGCNHCKTKQPLPNLSALEKSVMTFSLLHFEGGCKSIPNDLKDKLSQQRKESYSAIAEGDSPFLRPSQICNVIALYYNFENLSSTSKVDDNSNRGLKRKADKPLLGNNAQEKMKNSESVVTNISTASTEIPILPREMNVRKEIDESMNTLPNQSYPLVKGSLAEQKSKEIQKNGLVTQTRFERPLICHIQDGISTHLVPFGGVPLMSSITADRTASMLDCHRMLLKNLELFEGDKNEVRLRCSNCNSIPDCWTALVRGKKDLYRQIMLSHIHFNECKSTPSGDIDEIKRVGETFSSSPDDPMRMYCNFLAEVYGLKDAVSEKGDKIVRFSDDACLYAFGEYTCKNLTLRKKITGSNGAGASLIES